MKIKVFLFSLIAVIFSACGTNSHYFTPSAYDKIEAQEEFYSIKQTNINYAKLSNFKPFIFLNQDNKKITINIDGYQNYMLLAKYGEIIVLADDFGNVTLLKNLGNDNLSYQKESTEKIYENKFFGAIILASLNDDTLALVGADNTLYAVNLNNKETIFEYKQGMSLGQVSKLANPIFMDNYIIYPTLDAKAVFFDKNLGQITQNTPIGYEQFFNNILLLKNINSSLFVVSTTKILSLSDNNLSNIDINAKNALVHNGYIYVVTDDARLIKFDKKLQEISSVKFEFARINDMIFVDDKLYLLENNGYLINTDENFNNIKIDKIKNYKHKKTYATTSGFYFGRYFVRFEWWFYVI